MIKSFTCFIFCMTLIAGLYGQSMYNINAPASNGQNKDFIPASPSAASLGVFGQVPVGNYTGTAHVSVPLYTISYKDLGVGVGLSYHASGNKPDLFPGIVGLSWALNAGGSITRVVKGMPDYEAYDVGTVFIPVLYNPTAEPNWSDLSNLNTKLASGGYFTDQDRTNPDEFYFNFNGITGKFYMNQLSTFRVKSESNRFYKVEGKLESPKSFTMPALPQSDDIPFSRAYDNKFLQPRMLYKITITDDQGIKYIFGGVDNAIEFSRPGHSYSSHSMATIDNMITPMSWHLTSIESPNGYKIVLDYERGYEVTKVGFCDVIKSIWQSPDGTKTAVKPFPVVMGEKSTLVNTSYLKTITTPKEVVTFTYSDATEQLQFPTDPTMYQQAVVNENMFSWYGDISRAVTQNMRTKKLDYIEVRDALNTVHKSIDFEYTNNTSTRLKLLAVRLKGNDYKTSAVWSFDYNPLALPSYLSFQTDHYGFYNGRNPYINTSNPQHYYVDILNQQDFFNSKEPDPAFVQAEMLTKVTYPTGGFTTFEYEPNEYSTTVQTWPFTTVPGANRTTGGVRIKSTTDYTAVGQKAFSKKYFYTKNYLTGGTTSSGVLAYQPIYFEQISGEVTPPAKYSTWTSYRGPINLKYWSSNPIFPLSATRGNHVTYSEVTEVMEDNSAIVYKYKNYDNGYNDQAPINKVSDNTGIKEFWKEEEGISMDLERGQMLSEEWYDAAKVLKKKKEYEYNDDPARLNDNVRVLAQTFNTLNRADIPSLRITASLIYTYFPFLKKITETEYNGTQSLATVVNFEYDPLYRMAKTVRTTTSDGRLITTLNSYPKDLVNAGTTIPYQQMVTAGMVGMLISSEEQSNGTRLTKSTTEFSEGLSANATAILPLLTKTKIKDSDEEIKFNYHQYDLKGNMVSLSIPGSLTTCYVWSYNYSYPVAKIINADYATVLATLGGQQAVDNFAASMPTNSQVVAFLQPLRSNASLSAAQVHTYTYNLLAGMTSETDPNNRSTYYEYDFMGRLSIIRDHDQNILKKICYNYAGQIENCNAGPNYGRTEFRYNASQTLICNNGALQQVIIGYSRKTDPEDPALPSEFFLEKEMTTHPPDGYYKVFSSDVLPANNFMYYRMVGGKIISTHVCM